MQSAHVHQSQSCLCYSISSCSLTDSRWYNVVLFCTCWPLETTITSKLVFYVILNECISYLINVYSNLSQQNSRFPFFRQCRQTSSPFPFDLYFFRNDWQGLLTHISFHTITTFFRLFVIWYLTIVIQFSLALKLKNLHSENPLLMYLVTGKNCLVWSFQENKTDLLGNYVTLQCNVWVHIF